MTVNDDGLLSIEGISNKNRCPSEAASHLSIYLPARGALKSLPHAALAELARDLVMPECFADHRERLLHIDSRVQCFETWIKQMRLM